MESLADYNNNPGNLKPPKGVTYEGQLGVDEHGLAIFENKEFGRRALLNDIRHKIETRKLKTPEDFINIYAPAGDENSEESRDNYKIALMDALGLESSGDPFPEDSIEKISDVISKFEGASGAGETQQKPESDQASQFPAAAAAPAPADSELAAQLKREADRKEAQMWAGLGGAGFAAAKKPVLDYGMKIARHLSGAAPEVPETGGSGGVDSYAASQTGSRATREELGRATGMDTPETNAEVQQAVKRVSAEGHPAERIRERKLVRVGNQVIDVSRLRQPRPSRAEELRRIVAERPQPVQPTVGQRAMGALDYAAGSFPVRAPLGLMSAAGFADDLRRSEDMAGKAGSIAGITGGLGYMATPAASYPRISGGFGALTAGADVARRVRENDIPGAVVSGGSAVLPWAIRALTASPPGRAAVATSMALPIAYDLARGPIKIPRQKVILPNGQEIEIDM